MNQNLDCAICGNFKVNTAPREATCGRDECLAAYYPGGSVDELGHEIDLVDESAGHPTTEEFYATPEGRFLAQHNMSDYDKLLFETHSLNKPR